MGESMARMLQPLSEDDRKKFSTAIAKEISESIKAQKQFVHPHGALKSFHGKTAAEIIAMRGN